MESSSLFLVNGWCNEEKIGPKKHFGEALEENVSDICTKKNQNWYHQTSESVCCWLVVLEIIKKDAFLSILSLKKTMAGEESWQGCRVLISFTAENRVGSQGRHGKFDPDKAQYSTPNFFDLLFLIRV